MALPVVKKEDKVATRKVAAVSDLSSAAPILNKLLDTMRGRDQKENRFMSKHIDGESTEYSIIQDNNLNMLNILSSQSETERLLGSMKDITETDTVRTSSPVQILRPARQEIQERPRQTSRPVTISSISANSIVGRDVPKIVTESVKKIDSYVSTQQSDSKFSELRTINEETGEALQRSSGLLSNIEQSIQRHNQLLEKIIDNLKNQGQQEDSSGGGFDIDLGGLGGQRAGARSQARGGASRPQARGSVPEVRQSPRPVATSNRPNITGRIIGGVIGGIAAEEATSYLTGQDEGLSGAALSLAPVAAGVVGTTAAIKGAFELADKLTPEERKGATNTLEKTELVLADKRKISLIKDIDPFKAGQIVDVKDVIEKWELSDTEKKDFIKQLFDSKQIDLAPEGTSSTPVNDAEPVDKDLLSPVSQTYMDDTTDTGWQEAESTDTGWQEAGSEPTSRPMARPTRTRRQSSGYTSDSLTITARDVVFKSDKMEAPFLDAIKEELSDFMNTIMNVSGQGAAVTPNLAGGGMSSSGGLASPVSFANVSGGMRPPAMSSFGSGSDTSTQQGQDQSQSQGGTSEKPENVTIDSGVDISKVDKDLLSGFYAAAKDYGKPVKINSGFRGDEKQAELWVRANVFKEPGIYMPAKPDKPTTINYKGQTFNVPGGSTKSSHGGSSSSARALDVTRGALEEMDSMGLLRKYGLHRPFPNDPVHVERIGGRSAPPDTSTDGAQQASQVSATPMTATASGGESTDGGGEAATPVASTTSGGGEMTPGGGDQPASMTPSAPSSGPTVATASVDNEVAKRTPMTPSAPTPDVPSSGTSSPGVGDTSYPISMGNPGNVEPPDAAQRYALLFDMAA